MKKWRKGTQMTDETKSRTDFRLPTASKWTAPRAVADGAGGHDHCDCGWHAMQWRSDFLSGVWLPANVAQHNTTNRTAQWTFRLAPLTRLSSDRHYSGNKTSVFGPAKCDGMCIQVQWSMESTLYGPAKLKSGSWTFPKNLPDLCLG